MTRMGNTLMRLGNLYTLQHVTSVETDSLHGEGDTEFSTSSVYAVIYPFTVESQYEKGGLEDFQFIRGFFDVTVTVSAGDLITYGGRVYRIGPVQPFTNYIRFEAKEV